MKFKFLQLIFAFLICFSFCSFAFSQSAKAMKFDEFDDSSQNQYYPFYEEVSFPQRIERFIQQIKKERGIKIFIIYYQARIIKSFDRHNIKNWAGLTRSEVGNKTKIDFDNIIIIDGGIREKAMLEYWIVPKNAEPPKPTPHFDESESFVCPDFYVYENKMQSDKGKSLHFYVSVSDSKANVKFHWKVSEGEIVEGQGTDKIKVDTKDANANRITAFVEVGGLPFPCEKIGFATANVGNKAYLFDSAVRYNYSDLSARLDSFMIELNNNPTAKGYIITYANRTEGAKSMARATRSVRNSFAFRRYDLSRVVIINGGFREYDTVDSWIIPEGAEPPIPTPTVEKRFIVPIKKIVKKKITKRK